MNKTCDRNKNYVWNDMILSRMDTKKTIFRTDLKLFKQYLNWDLKSKTLFYDLMIHSLYQLNVSERVS
jgi:hypothetical protein